MILFHPELLSEVPNPLLVNLHRQVCKIRTNPWRHPTSKTWFYNMGWTTMVWYHTQVMDEMLTRGFKPAVIWRNVSYHGKRTGTIPTEAVDKIPEDEFNLVYPYNKRDDRFRPDKEYLALWKKKHNLL